MPRAKGPELRTYEVFWDRQQPPMIIEAHYAFDNTSDGQGLVFRRYKNDDTENKTYIVASFGSYLYFKEISHDTGSDKEAGEHPGVLAGPDQNGADR